MFRSPLRRSIGALCPVVFLLSTSAFAQVISEIHYNPPVGEESLEFIEIFNETKVPRDLSGYHFTSGIQFTFPDPFILSVDESVVICRDLVAFRKRYPIENAIGNFENDSRLDANGEEIALANHQGIVIERVDFRDRGEWPTLPDGTGHTLVLKTVHHAANEPESWTTSPELGGSPGRRNFPRPGEEFFIETEIMPVGIDWRFRRGTEAFSEPIDAWTKEEFDDATWDVGPSGFGYGDDDDATILEDMEDNYTTVAIRTRVNIDAEFVDGPGRFLFGVFFDDGFCIYVNGTRATESRCPEEWTHESTATSTHEARVEEFFAIPKGLLRAGENTIAVLALNRSIGNNDLTIAPRIVHRRPPDQEALLGVEPFFTELYRGNRGPAWFEIYNSTDETVNLTGLEITENPDSNDGYVFPEGSELAAGEYLALTAADTGLELATPVVRLFLRRPGGVTLAAETFEQTLPETSDLKDFAEVRLPGSDRDWITDMPTPGEANVAPVVSDLVINEIYYHPPEDRPGEFLELYNRGEDPIDLSFFHFSKGINFAFEEGTTIAGGAYLVLAQDPELLSKHYGFESALGPWEGQLADGGENIRLLDRNGNMVDEVRYYDGGAWPKWADGGGASLELLDPWQNNDFPTAWRDSDEEEKTSWEELKYTVARYAPAGESELHVFLSGSGVARLDDVSVVPAAGGQNLVSNSGFEEDTRPWRIQGTHFQSVRTTDDAHSGEACLEIIASGRGDTSCNRIETDTGRLSATSYEVSLRMRWLRGANLVVCHGEFAAGPWPGTRDNNLSNNSLGARLRMSIPWNLGSPGEENSVRRQLLEVAPEGNTGPVIADAIHSPAAATSEDPLRIAARVSDSDGVRNVRARYRIDDGRVGDFESIEMVDDGTNGDEVAGDGVYSIQLPSFSNGQVVLYYVEAEDELSETATFPLAAPDDRHVVRIQSVADTIQIALDLQTQRELSSRPLHSNHLVDASFVFDHQEVYYNIGLRYRGSPWGRPSRQSYRVSFPKDNRYRSRLRQLNITNRDRNDGIAYYLIGRGGTPEAHAPVSDYQYMRTRVNGASFGNPGVFDPVNGDFIEKWYGNDASDDAVVLKGIGRLRFNDACSRTGWDEATLQYMEESPENYRFYYTHSLHANRDNWGPLYSLTRLLSTRETPNDVFDETVNDIIDMDTLSKVFGPRIMMADWDALYVGNGHNGYIVWDPTDGRWEYLAFDFGGAFGGFSGLTSIRDVGLRRVFTRPVSARAYYRNIDKLLKTSWSSDRSRPWLTEMQRAAATGASTINYLTTNASAVSRSLNNFVNIPLEIRTNRGDPVTTDESEIELDGRAPVQIEQLLVSRNDEEPVPVDLRWTQTTRWVATLEVPDADNQFEFLGFDGTGEFVASTTFRVFTGATFVRGDANGDQNLNLSDAVATLNYLFGARELPCLDAADVDDDGSLGISDPIAALNFLFQDGGAPSAPYPDPGIDPSADKLDCTP
ncbi:MAG: lamin tail domain-containing protein [Planctomycetota bacterium]